MPADIAAFPSCLVAEAVGQLAAWVAMAHIGFRGRPVAALANETRFLATVRAGRRLELARRDRELRRRSGRLRAARRDVDGRRVIELQRLPGTDAAGRGVRRSRGAGASASRCCAATARAPGRFRGVVAPARDDRERRAGRVASRARCRCPTAAPFFADHFRAVRCSRRRCCSTRRSTWRCKLAPSRRTAGARAAGAVRMTHVKMRAFIAPGQTSTSRVEACGRATGDTATFMLSRAMRRQDRRHRARRDRLAERDDMSSGTQRRVAITGLGLVTPVGNDVATTWDALLAGRSGGAPISLFDASGFSGAHRRRGEGLRRDALIGDRKLLKFTNSLAPLRAGRGRAGAARRRHPAHRGRRARAGAARSAPA